MPSFLKDLSGSYANIKYFTIITDLVAMFSMSYVSPSALAVLCLALLAFGVNAVTQARPKAARVVEAGAAPAGADRVMNKRYSWELEEKSMLAKSKFPIKPTALIARAKEVIDRDILDADDLAEDFTFQFPVVGPLSKAEYLKAVGGFQVSPDIVDAAAPLGRC